MEKSFLQRLQKVKIKDLLSIIYFILAIIPSLLIKLFNPHIWIVSDCEDEARDNGYYFFKYLREEIPEQDVYFAISKKSYDYEKVKKLGKVVNFGSFYHWILYLACEYNISSQKACKPNAAIGYILEKCNIVKHKIIFLQHGIIKDNLPYIHFKNAKFKMFTTSVEREYQYVKDNFGYKNNEVKKIGLCRFDDLTDTSNGEIILVMPTWRQWISNKDFKTKDIENVSNFVDTEYFKKWSSFLSNKELYDILENYNKKIIFYPHRHMQQYIDHFKYLSNNRIIIATFPEYDVHNLLKKASLLITDYSSVAMDFAYLNKPIDYYQFDYQRFRENHLELGYFSYKNDAFGPLFEQEQDLINHIKKQIESNYKLDIIYQKRINDFFDLRDNHNCERTYLALKSIK